MDRKRRIARPGVEPMDRRELLSGLMIALQAPVPQLSVTQEAAIASNLGQPATAATVSAEEAVTTKSNSGPATGNAAIGGSNTASVGGGLYNGNNNPQGISFPDAPIIGTGTPTAAELAREKFVAKFKGPLATVPGRFSDQKDIIFLRGLGGSTPNFFLHADYSLAIVIPTGFNPANPAGTGPDNPAVPPGSPSYVPPVTGFAFLDDKNNNSGGVVGLDLVAVPTSFDSKGRPTQLTFTADQNVYGGIFFVDAAAGTVTITYGRNTATAIFNGRIYTSGLTNPFENVDLYSKNSG
jgi:hypothetical protein